MNKDASSQRKKQKNRKLEYILISSDSTEPTFCILEDAGIIDHEEEKIANSTLLSSQYYGEVIDMNGKYKRKTKEQLVMTLTEELIKSQSNFHETSELPSKFEHFKLTSTPEGNKSSSPNASMMPNQLKVTISDDCEDVNEECMYIDSPSKLVEQSIINRRDH